MENQARNCFERGYEKTKKGEYQKALIEYTEAIQLKPNYILAYVLRGLTFLQLNDCSVARQDLLDANRLPCETAEDYLGRGTAKFTLGKKLEAIADFDKAIILNSDYVDAYHGRGVTKLALEDYHGAINDFENTIRIKPDHCGAYLNRGIAKQSLGNNQGAIADFNRSIEISANHESIVEEHISYNNQALAREILGDYHGAINDLDECILIKPHDALSYFHRSSLKYKLGDKKGTQIDLEKAAELFKQQGDVEKYNHMLYEIELYCSIS